MAKRKGKNKERSRPHSESILLRLPPDQYARLQALSDGRGENVQAITRFALAETLPDLEMALEKAITSESEVNSKQSNGRSHLFVKASA